MKTIFKLVMSILIYGIASIVSLWLVVMLIFLGRFQLDAKVIEKTSECRGREIFARADKTGNTKVPEWCLRPSTEEKTLSLITKPGFYYGVSALLGLVTATPFIYIGLWKKTKVKKKLAKI